MIGHTKGHKLLRGSHLERHFADRISMETMPTDHERIARDSVCEEDRPGTQVLLGVPRELVAGKVVAAAFAYNTALIGEVIPLLGGNRLRSAWIEGAVFLSSRITTSSRSPSSSPRQGVPYPALMELRTPPPDSLPPAPDPAPENAGCHRLSRPSPR